MPTYERSVRIAAPLDAVYEFHSRIDGLLAVTPDVARLRAEYVVGPDGEADPEILEAGSEIRLTVRPLGIGPRRGWTSVITDRERSDGTAFFRDEMVDGPFRSWIHTHRFFADGENETVLLDRVEYELPEPTRGLPGTLTDPLREIAIPVAGLGLDAAFRHRHRETRRLLEARPSGSSPFMSQPPER